MDDADNDDTRVVRREPPVDDDATLVVRRERPVDDDDTVVVRREPQVDDDSTRVVRRPTGVGSGGEGGDGDKDGNKDGNDDDGDETRLARRRASAPDVSPGSHGAPVSPQGRVAGSTRPVPPTNGRAPFVPDRVSEQPADRYPIRAAQPEPVLEPTAVSGGAGTPAAAGRVLNPPRVRGGASVRSRRRRAGVGVIVAIVAATLAALAVVVIAVLLLGSVVGVR